MLIQWVKPNDTVMETNDWPETVKYCESLGYKRKEKEQPKAEMPTDEGQSKRKRGK